MSSHEFRVSTAFNTRARSAFCASICACLTLMLVSNGSALTTPSFRAHKEFTAFSSQIVGTPGVFAQDDLNGDGIADLVVPAVPVLQDANPIVNAFQPPPIKRGK